MNTYRSTSEFTQLAVCHLITGRVLTHATTKRRRSRRIIEDEGEKIRVLVLKTKEWLRAKMALFLAHWPAVWVMKKETERRGREEGLDKSRGVNMPGEGKFCGFWADRNRSRLESCGESLSLFFALIDVYRWIFGWDHRQGRVIRDGDISADEASLCLKLLLFLVKKKKNCVWDFGNTVMRNPRAKKFALIYTCQCLWLFALDGDSSLLIFNKLCISFEYLRINI